MATFTLNPQAVSSGTISVPVNGVTIPAQAHTASVTYLMPVQAERLSTNPRILLDYRIETSGDGGATWKPRLNANWRSSSDLGTARNSTVVHPPPTAVLGGDFFGAFAGQVVRITTHLSDPMTLGLTVTVL